MGKGKKQSKKTGKTQRFCAGCHKVEPKGERFNQCPRCTEEGFVPAVFCSNSCFKEAWPEHKEWHSKEGQENKGTLIRGIEGLAAKTRGAAEHHLGASYGNLIAQHSRLLANGDINGAKKILQKAQNLSPKEPMAFMFLYAIFQACNQNGEAATCANEACMRLALATVTGFIADKKIHDDMFVFWAIYVGYVFEWCYCDPLNFNNVFPKLNWWNHDSMLKRITKVALKGIKEFNLAVTLDRIEDPKLTALSSGDVITKLRCLRFLSLSRCPARGNVRMTLNRTSEELEEAAVLCKSLIEQGVECANAFPNLLEKMKNAAITADRGSPLEKGEAGLWVLIHGLESKEEKALNGKFGLIFKDGVENGRVALEVDGFDGEKRMWIPPKKLWELPFSEKQVALISTMDKDDQWVHVKGSAQLSLAHRCLAGRSVQSKGA